MMIQPTMYFNLRHVPMFYGPYFITNVSHDINVNGFETNFEGMRQPIFSFPSIDKLVMSVNKNLLKKYETVYRKKQTQQEAQNATNQTNNSTSTNPFTPGDESACEGATKYPTLTFVDFEDTRIPVNDVITYLNSITRYSRNLRSYCLGVGYIANKGNLGSFDCTNNNINGVLSNNLRYQNLTGFTNGQVCIKATTGGGEINAPLFSFENKENAIKFFIEYNNAYNTLINNLVGILTTIVNDDEKLATALTYIYLTTWNSNSGVGKTATEIKQIVDTNISNGTIKQEDFDKIKEKMLSAVIKILA